MALILTNCTFDVLRSIFTVGKGTLPATIHMSGVIGHLQEIPARHVRMGQNSAVNLTYELKVDYGLDVRFSDIIVNITDTYAGIPLPAMVDGTQTWRVVNGYDTTPGPLSYRMLVIERIIAGGQVPL